MQGKGCYTMIYFQKSRKAFSIITAIFLIVIMAGVGVFITVLSGKMVQTTVEQYQREQAILLAKSYTELAIMAVMSNDRNGTGNCVDQINSSTGDDPTKGDGYNIRVRISFIGANGDISACSDVRELDNPVTLNSDELNIVVDTYVEFKDTSHNDPSNAPWRIYHKRTLQKI
jgi:hypothetical protein